MRRISDWQHWAVGRTRPGWSVRELETVNRLPLPYSARYGRSGACTEVGSLVGRRQLGTPTRTPAEGAGGRRQSKDDRPLTIGCAAPLRGAGRGRANAPGLGSLNLATGKVHR